MNKASGQGLVEYALILVLVAVVIVVSLSLFGNDLAEVYSNIIESIP
jgi:pilus assembly protein Flp/PilA